MRARQGRSILLAIVLVPVAAVLGFVGYSSIPGSNLSTTDAMYGTLQLYSLEAAIPPQGTPWQLDVARFLAPLSVVYAVVVAAVALLRDQVQRALVAAFARGHVLVVGLGETGSMVAKGLRQSGWQVVAIDPDAQAAGVAAARAEGVRVILGDGSSSAFLRRARITRARHVVVLTGDDSRNLEIAALARHCAEGAGSGSATVHVAISDAGLWKELSRLQLAEVTQRVTTECFNLADRAAQRLLGEAELLAPGGALRRILVDGNTSLATRVVTHLVRRALVAGVRPKIDLTSAADGQLMATLRTDEPWCLENADIRAVDIDEAYCQDPPPVALVCPAQDDAVAITRGLALARRLPATRVLAAVFRERSETTLDAAGARVPRLHLVSVQLETLGRELLDRSGIELMARARHEDYLRCEHVGGMTEQDNPSLVPWERLPESLKESNRRFAQSLGAVLADVGASMVPLSGPASSEGLPVDSKTLDRLARGEHERWLRAMVRDGWRSTSGAKDAARKVHPLLVSWDELDAGEQEKDRDAVRALPHMLARVGYAIVVPEQGS